jgi:hypothetical protein
MPVPKENQSVCTQPVVAFVTNSRLNPCGDIKEVARRLSSQSCDKKHNPQGNVPIANERRIRLAEDALSAQFGTSILAAGDGSFTSTPADRSAQIAVTTDRRMAWGTPVGRELPAPTVMHPRNPRRAPAPTSALSRQPHVSSDRDCLSQERRHVRKGCCDGQLRLDAAESMGSRRRWDFTSQDHLQARAVGRLETQWNHCVRYASFAGIGVPVCLPRTQAHCAVMSAIV